MEIRVLLYEETAQQYHKKGNEVYTISHVMVEIKLANSGDAGMPQRN
jgi:hypothetical protein